MKFRSRNGFQSKNNGSQSEKVVAKRLGKEFWTETRNPSTLCPRGGGPGGRGVGGWINPSPIDDSKNSKKFYLKKDPKPPSRWAGATTTTTTTTPITTTTTTTARNPVCRTFPPVAAWIDINISMTVTTAMTSTSLRL